MEDWLSHFQDRVGGSLYDRMQLLRPDYTKAMRSLSTHVKALLKDSPARISVLDAACGSGMATRKAFESVPPGQLQKMRFYGLDNDRVMLKQAKSNWPELKTIRADITQAQITKRFDIILCSFAYHHVRDSKKKRFCKNLYRWSKPSGHVFVLEICLNQGQVRRYYAALKNQLRKSAHVSDAQHFLDWTSGEDRRENGEWKVPLRRVLFDFTAAGWNLVNSAPLWQAPELPRQSGCYLLHFQRMPST